MSARNYWLLLLSPLALYACESLLVEPAAPDGPHVQFAFGGDPSTVSVYGDLTLVLEKVRQVRLRFVREGEARDTTVSGRFEDGELQVRVRLSSEEMNAISSPGEPSRLISSNTNLSDPG